MASPSFGIGFERLVFHLLNSSGSPSGQKCGTSPTRCYHTFRATGITAYLENGGSIENAQAIAATLEEVERIGI